MRAFLLMLLSLGISLLDQAIVEPMPLSAAVSFGCIALAIHAIKED